MMDSYDLVIIGAGPAGMSAAIEASENGLKTLVLDDQPSVGGQVYRHILQNEERRTVTPYLGEDYWAGHKLASDFRKSSADIRTESRVWQVTSEKDVFFSQMGKAHRVQSDAILIATGAMERPMPIKGWTLPGVMSVGAAQTMLKTNSSGADSAVFAGTGPLFYLTIWQYLRAGFEVKAVIDTAPNYISPAHYFVAITALLQPRLLMKGVKWRSEIRKKTRYYSGAQHVCIDGNSAAENISFMDSHGKEHQILTNQIFIHQGVVPNINLTMATELAHRWCPRQLCWYAETDIFGQSSIDGIFVAGDGAGIAGASSAEHSGKIAARRILLKEKAPSFVHKVIWQCQRWRQRAIRPFLDAVFRPPDEWLVPDDNDVIVCRCESLTKGQVSEAIGLGISGPNQLKSFCRAGMGRCQGRMCGLTIQKMIADYQKQPEEKIGYFRLRPPIRPLTVGELAALVETDASP